MNTYYKILNEIASIFDMDQWDEQVNLFTKNIKEALEYFVYLNSYPYSLKIFGGHSHAKFYGKNNIYVNEKHIELDNGYMRLGQEFANIDKINVIITDLDETIATHATQQDPTSSEWGCCNMFGNCTKLYSVPCFDTSKVTNMGFMFQHCTSLVSVPKFNTTRVTNMNSLFCDCESLKSVPLLDTSKVNNMDDMFYNCTSLSKKTKQEWSSVYNFKIHQMG